MSFLTRFLLQLVPSFYAKEKRQVNEKSALCSSVGLLPLGIGVRAGAPPLQLGGGLRLFWRVCHEVHRRDSDSGQRKEERGETLVRLRSWLQASLNQKGLLDLEKQVTEQTVEASNLRPSAWSPVLWSVCPLCLAPNSVKQVPGWVCKLMGGIVLEFSRVVGDRMTTS